MAENHWFVSNKVLDAIITVVAIWGFWRWCLRGAAMRI
jgi:hypothetical protein